MTKQDIDALVDAMPSTDDSFGSVAFGGCVATRDDIRCALYLAAGLNADGSEKARVVKAWLYTDTSAGANPIYGTWDGATFTPDREAK